MRCLAFGCRLRHLLLPPGSLMTDRTRPILPLCSFSPCKCRAHPCPFFSRWTVRGKTRDPLCQLLAPGRIQLAQLQVSKFGFAGLCRILHWKARTGTVSVESRCSKQVPKYSSTPVLYKCTARHRTCLEKYCMPFSCFIAKVR